MRAQTAITALAQTTSTVFFNRLTGCSATWLSRVWIVAFDMSSSRNDQDYLNHFDPAVLCVTCSPLSRTGLPVIYHQPIKSNCGTRWGPRLDHSVNPKCGTCGGGRGLDPIRFGQGRCRPGSRAEMPLHAEVNRQNYGYDGYGAEHQNRKENFDYHRDSG
jgi:hypothetical protein